MDFISFILIIGNLCSIARGYTVNNTEHIAEELDSPNAPLGNLRLTSKPENDVLKPVKDCPKGIKNIHEEKLIRTSLDITVKDSGDDSDIIGSSDFGEYITVYYLVPEKGFTFEEVTEFGTLIWKSRSEHENCVLAAAIVKDGNSEPSYLRLVVQISNMSYDLFFYNLDDKWYSTDPRDYRARLHE